VADIACKAGGAFIGKVFQEQTYTYRGCRPSQISKTRGQNPRVGESQKRVLTLRSCLVTRYLTEGACQSMLQAPWFAGMVMRPQIPDYPLKRMYD
jgi:hypothetical protein